MEYKLSEIAEIVSGGTPSTKNVTYWNGKISWITPKDLSTNKKRYISCGERNITEKGLNNSSAIMLPKNSILFTSRAPIGYIAISENEVCTNQGFKSLICDDSKCYFLYLYYWLLNNIDYIKSQANGSTFQEISGTAMKKIKINLPSINIQKRIAKILDYFDKKIELNNQINDNLHNISKNIFGNFYKSNVNNWSSLKIGSIGLYISDYVANGSFKSLAENVKIYDEKNYALFIRNTDLKVNFTQERKYVDEHSYNFLNKSKLYGRELIISNVGDVGSVFLCPSFEMPMTLGNNVIMVDSKETNVNYNYYLYYFFKGVDGQYLIDGITGGSAQPKFNKTDFRNSLIKLPSSEEIKKFNDKIIPMYDIIEKNIIENRTLEQLRDTLLPKLMNGEIDLDKVEI